MTASLLACPQPTVGFERWLEYITKPTADVRHRHHSIMSALVSLLETFDVVWAIFQILENAKESDIVEPNKVGRSVRADQLKGGNSLVALSSCSKATRDCLRWIIFDIQRPNRRIPTFLLAGHDDLFCYGSSEESKSHFLELVS